jgi:hypothetical protein
MESERRFIPKSEKPPVLFHGSPNPDIAVFEPRQEKVRDENEGPCVFGTPSRAFAALFLVEVDESWVDFGAMDETPYIVISDEARFRAADKGGVIYSFPSTTFETDPQKGMREMEWTSPQPVTPTKKENVASALADMVKYGVKIYFIDKATYADIQQASDGGESIVKSLVPYKG